MTTGSWARVRQIHANEYSYWDWAGGWEVSCRSEMLPTSAIYPCVAWSRCACFTSLARRSCSPPHQRASHPRRMQGLGEGPLLPPAHPGEESAAPSFRLQSTPSRFTQSSSRRPMPWIVGTWSQSWGDGIQLHHEPVALPTPTTWLVGLPGCSAPRTYSAHLKTPCPHTAARVLSAAQCHALPPCDCCHHMEIVFKIWNLLRVPCAAWQGSRAFWGVRGISRVTIP